MDTQALTIIIYSVAVLGVLAPLEWGAGSSGQRPDPKPPCDEQFRAAVEKYLSSTGLCTTAHDCFEALWEAVREASVACCAWVEGTLAPEFRVRASRSDGATHSSALPALLMSDHVRRSLGAISSVVCDPLPPLDNLGAAADELSALAVIPMVSGGDLLGSLVFATREPGGFGEARLHYLRTLTSVFAGGCERALLRDRLAQAEGRYGELVNATPTFLVAIDPEGTVVLFNRSLELATGQRERDVLGRDGSRCLSHLADDVDLHAMLLRELLKPTLPTVRARLTTANHRELVVDWRVTRLCHGNGDPFMVVAVGADATVNARLETELVHLERLATAGQLLAGTAHELNNPLAAVVGFAELLQQFRTDERCRDYLDKLHSQAQRARRIVQNLLTFAREQPADHEPTSVHELVSQTLELVRYQMEVKNVTFRVSISPELPRVLGNPHELQQVLVNLLTNARDALGEVGGGEVEVSAQVDGGAMRLVVGDGGPGIRDDLLATLFEPFVTSKPQGAGTGLGLSISQGIIQQHNGTISARNRPRGGAEFTITLPIAEGTSRGTVRDPGKPAAPGSRDRDVCGHRVLVVDDEEMLRALVADVLSEEGYAVDQASNGDEALELAAQNEYGAVICDLKMPGLSGEVIYDRLCELRPGLAQRVIFATGDTSGQACEGLLSRAGDKLLHKPFSIAQLVDLTSQVVACLD